MRHHGKYDALAPARIGNPERPRPRDIGAGAEYALQFGAIDILAAPYDHVLLAVDDGDEPVGIQETDVAGAQPAILEDRGIGLWLVSSSRP